MDFAGCTKAKTMALHKNGAVAAAAAVRGLSDEQLARSGTVFAGVPAMSSEQLVGRGNLLPFYRDVLGLGVAVQTPGFVVLGDRRASTLALGTH